MSINFRFGNAVNETFQDIFLLAVTFSVPVLVASVYTAAFSKNYDFTYFTMVDIFVASIVQIYTMCWYGNEVTLNVSTQNFCFSILVIKQWYNTLQSCAIGDTVYEINWIVLDSSSIKCLLVLNTRANNPLNITIGYIIPINIETFLKVSIYSNTYSIQISYNIVV